MFDVIEAWHTAVNAGDAPAAGALCTDDVQVGDLTAPVRVATAFGVADGRISRVLRHTDLDGALAAAGLTTKDEVTAPVGSAAWP